MSIKAVSSERDVPINPPERQRKVESLENRIKQVFAKILLVLVYAIFFPVTIAAAGYRIYSYFNTKNLVEALAQKRFIAVREAHRNITPDETDEALHRLDGHEDDVSDLVNAVEEIDELLGSGFVLNDKMHDYMQEVREKVDAALGLPAYHLNKGNVESQYIQVLHAVAHALTANAEGMDILERHGREVIEGCYSDNDELSYNKLATVLDLAVKKHRHFQKNSKIGKIFWIFAHPEKAFNSLFDHLGWTDPLSYNSYRQGNANIRIGAFKVGDVKMHLSLGPTPTADRLFEAHLQYLRNKDQGQVHFQHDLEFAGTPGERDRRLEKKRIADRHQDGMIYMATPLDGAIWKGRDAFKNIQSTKDFFSQLEVYMNGYREMPSNPKQDNSFYIPEKVLESKEDLKTLLDVTEIMFINQEKATDSPKMDRRRLNRAQLLGFEGMLAVQAILKSAKDMQGPIDCYMGQACKQDIDRGVLLNVMTILYFDALGGVSLSEERINQIVGIVLARSGMVDDRAILKNRFSALSDLLHIISCDPEGFFAPMKAHFGVNSVAFETVNVE